VATAPVSTRPVVYLVETHGSLEAYETVVVPARVEGTIESLDFEEGTAVTPATVLAEIDTERYALEVRRAENAVAQAEGTLARAAAQIEWEKASLAEAESNLARRRAIREKNPDFVSEEEITTLEAAVARFRASQDRSRADEQGARAALEEARTRVALARKNLADSKVRSPLAGVVERKHVAAGQYLQAGDPIATLVDTHQLRLRFRVGEAEVVRLREGQKVAFRVQSFPDREFEADLVHIQGIADPATRRVECLATVADPDPALRPGFFATVRIEVSREEEAVVIPEGAILPTEWGFVAFVVEEGTARRRDLVLGLHTREGGIEVLSGLRPGEALVVEGTAALEDGVRVQVVSGPGAVEPPPGKPE
jgi:multidrug efflux system membrane fusion protein